MKTFFALFTAFIFVFAGCSSDSDSDFGETFTLASQGQDEIKSSETANNFKYEDKTGLTSKFGKENGNKGREDFSMDNGYFKAAVSSGTGGNTISNWMFSNIGTKITGFEAEIKINENMNRAGIEWRDVKNGSPTYTYYWLNIVSDGKFRIDHCKYENSKSNWTKIKELSKEQSHIDLGKLNKIKVKRTDSGKTEIYVNGYLVHSIENGSLKINPGTVGISYSLKSGTTYSSSTKAESWFKFITIQTAK